MALRIYLDTSVFSAYDDDRAPDRMAQTREFWGRLSQFSASTSELAAQELSQTPDPQRRARLLGMLDTVAVHPLTDEMRGLANRDVDRGVFTAGMYADALHVAAAVLLEQEVLVSWNFKHLVNRRRRAQVNEINILSGLPTVEIVAPPEM